MNPFSSIFGSVGFNTDANDGAKKNAEDQGKIFDDFGKGVTETLRKQKEGELAGLDVKASKKVTDDLASTIG
jgi:hypothetical protein